MAKQPKQFGCCGTIAVLFAAGLVGMCVIGMLLPKPPPRQPAAPPAQVAVPPPTAAGSIEPPAPSRPAKGEEGVLSLAGAGHVFIAVDDDAWDAMIDAENARDVEEIALLMAKGKVIREAVGTRVKVLERRITSTKVRVRDGNNPGAEGWIQYDFVAKP